MKKNSVLVVAALITVFVISLTYDGYSTTVKHYNLKGLVSKAERIFTGQCISAEEAEIKFPKGSIWCAEYVFRISEGIKGTTGEIITFRQYGLINPRQIGENTVYFNRPVGMPIYEVNQEYMLFLIGDSKLRLTGPAGLFQGAFLIYQDELNRRVAINGSQNRGLFKKEAATELKQFDLTPSEKTLVEKSQGAFALDDFVSVVKKFAEI